MYRDSTESDRRSIRLQDYDYSQAGAYFVTVCAWSRRCLLGDVVKGETRLTKYGMVVENEWLRTGTIRPNIQIDGFVVMPNHLHGILMLRNVDDDIVGATRRVARSATNRVSTSGRATQRVAPTMRRAHGPKSGSIGAIIGQFKSASAKQINKIRGTLGSPVWQRNYYEHVIRNRGRAEQDPRIHRQQSCPMGAGPRKS